MLLLRGPPGCGKTATVKVLAKEFQIGIQEWIVPIEVVEFKSKYDRDEDDHDNLSFNDQVPYIGQKRAFRNFLLRANRYKALNGLGSDNGITSGRQLVLLEEIPSFAYKDPAEFHSFLAEYRSKSKAFPLIIIQSESNNDDGKKRKKYILNDDMISELRLDEISFNAVATTNLVKSLTAIANSEAKSGVRSFKIPDKDALTALAESSGGDIRGAINALQFACLKG